MFDIFNPNTIYEDMKFDLISTLEPYTTWWGFLVNLLQPVSGAINIILGVLQLAAAVVATFTLFPLFLCCWRSIEAAIFPCMPAISGLMFLARGITQILSSPLTYVFKVPIRLFQTVAHHLHGTEKQFFIENREDVQQQVHAMASCQYVSKGSCEKLHTTYKAYRYRGVNTTISAALEQNQFTAVPKSDDWPCHHEPLIAYIGMFKPNYILRHQEEKNPQKNYRTMQLV